MADGFNELAHPMRILARAMYKQLVSEGYDVRQIIVFATEIIALVTGSFAQAAGTRRSGS